MASGAFCTVSVVLPVTPVSAADIVVVPADTPVANPLTLTVATAVFDEVHVTWLLRFCVLLSEYVPVATNCCVPAVKIVGFNGVTAIELNVGGVCTVSVVPPLTLPSAADIVVVPADTPVANPLALTVATAVFDEVHVT